MTTASINILAKSISPIAAKYGVSRMKLFGSRARGDHNSHSDYDFLISRGRMRSLLQYSAFVAELESVLGTHVDVITDTSDDKQLITTAENEGVEIYGSK
ncbi:MAG: nucleotidyltransferase domain-containing protein [Salinivirgaceae bacterium]|nr:nucleotidyltransferase domain-containing protein [Salinivirgaceae bacterium]